MGLAMIIVFSILLMILILSGIISGVINLSDICVQILWNSLNLSTKVVINHQSFELFSYLQGLLANTIVVKVVVILS